ncbi:interleukin-15 isoform X2 [Narcine bancroftii]|uniref:interleukin-15 isoform X2 n=1 Tax=Narcine bancroftii TaxID=1343680 RepID=UPI0038321F9F
MSLLLCIFALTLPILSLMPVALCTQRRQVKRVYFNYYLHLNLDCHIFTFINSETGISLLLLCSLAVCLTKVDGADSYRARKTKRSAEIKEILMILRSIQTQVKSKYRDELKLYAPENVMGDCFETAFNCFILELKVVYYEFELESMDDLEKFQIIFKNAQLYTKIIAKGCTICEEFQEKNITEFLKAFEALLQMHNREMKH